MKHRLRRVLVWGWLLVVVGMVVGVIVEVLWGGPEAERSNRAGFFATLLGIASIVPPVAVWAWRRRGGVAEGTSTRAEVDTAADRLAEQTLETWSRQVVQRGIQSPAPVRVRWRWATEDIALPREELAAAPAFPTDPGPLPSNGDDQPPVGEMLNAGLVTRLHDEVYARMHHGRLVLIGGPGAGKTGAMILLLLEALRYRERMRETARIDVPVPVWLPLGSWDPMSESLQDWVTATLGRDHPYLRATDFGPDAVGQLSDTGRIALFLDGLDEMPDMQRRKAIERLSDEAAGRRMVITSRPDEFRETIDLGRRQLPYTAVIELRPVGPKAAAKYLLEGQVGPARQAWQPVADDLLAHPDGVLARTLNTPLMLSLARAAYQRDDPGSLTGVSAHEHDLRVHLLDQILIAAYPDTGEREHATHWLSWLAAMMSTQPDGPIRELRWWQIPSWIPRWQVGLAFGLVFGLVFGLLFGLMLLVVFGSELPGLVVGLVLGLGGGLVGGLLVRHRVQRLSPRSVTPKWNLISGFWPAFVIPFVVIGLLSGLTVGLGSGPGPIAGLVSGLVSGLMVGLCGFLVVAIAVWSPPLAATVDATPSSVHQKDVQSQLLSSLMIGLLVGVGLALLDSEWFFYRGLIVGLGNVLLSVIVYGIGLGLPVGLLAVSSGAASSLLFTELALWAQGRKVRFMPLLETALDRQVLRQAGAVYQFRHADLQDRLADQYEAGLLLQRRIT
jgi:hypothetical protein